MSLLISAPPKRQRALSFEEIEEEYQEAKRTPFHFSDDDDEESNPEEDDSDEEDNDNYTMEEISPRFTVERVLGKGSYGLVVRATDSTTQDRTVAVKRLRHIFDTCEVAQRVLNEVKLLKALGVHPNVTSLYAVLREAEVKVESYNQIYMVLEVAHSDLFKVLNSTILLDRSQVQSIMHQTLTAVSWIHSHHVVHCDVKPANLLIDKDCRIRLADFGLSRWGSKSTSSEDPPNKQASDDPQQASSNGTLSPKSASSIQVSTKGARFLRIDSFCDESMDPSQHAMQDPVALECCYRSPEVLWPCDDNEPYRTSLDIWSVGCVFADLLCAMSPDSTCQGSNTQEVSQPPSSIPLDSEGRVLGGHKVRPPLFAISEVPSWLGLMTSASIASFSQDSTDDASTDRTKSPVSANGRYSKSPRPQINSFSFESRRVLGSFVHVLGTESFNMKGDRLSLSDLPYLSVGARNFILAATDLNGISSKGTIDLPVDPQWSSLLRQLLCFVPHLRPSAEGALDSKFFEGLSRVPLPKDPISMPTPTSFQRAQSSTLRKELWGAMDGPINDI